MRKKRLIILCSILSVLAVLIILTSTVFMLSSVKVNFLMNEMQVLSEADAEGIIKSAKFNYGTNILFAKFNKQSARIEKAYPFTNVYKIERKFPNKLIVHIVERSPAVHIKQDGIVYVLDSDYKVLISVFAENFNSNEITSKDALITPQLIGFPISENASAGDFENNNTAMNVVKSIEIGLKKISHSILDLTKIMYITSEDEPIFNIYVGNNSMYLQIKGDLLLEQKVTNGFGAYFEQLENKGDMPGYILVTDQIINAPQFVEGE